MKGLAPFGIGLLLSLLSCTSHAIDAVTVVVGDSDSTNLLRVESEWTWASRWFASDGGYLSGYWDLDLAGWRETKWRDVPDHHRDLGEIGITPMFRYRGNGNTGYYVDGGIGLHQFSALYNNGGRELSTHFEFGSVIGVGYRFASGWECGADIEHYSNGGISSPNSGVNFFALRGSKTF